MENKKQTVAPLSAVAAHWRVRTETARRILAAHGVPTIVRGGRRYAAWTDVLTIEGVSGDAREMAVREPLLTRDDVAERYGVSPRTARRWLGLGHLPAIRLGPRILRARRADLDADDVRRREAA